MISITYILGLSLVGISFGLPQVPHITPKFQVLKGISNLQRESGFPPITPKQSGSCSVTYAFTQSGVTGTLSSTGYTGNYPAGSQCNYDISSPAGTTMAVKCTDFNVPCTNDAFWISLSGDAALQRDTTGYCGAGTINSVTVGNKLFMALKSSTSTTSARRFQCQITVQGTPQTTTPTTTPAPTTTSAPAPATTAAPAPASTAATSCQCGTKNQQTRIVGGTTAAEGEFPHRVLLFPYDPATGSGGVCGGTIIAPSWILTASHCTMDLKDGNQILVFYNTTKNAITTGAAAPSITVPYKAGNGNVIQHPSFSRTTLNNDLCLIKLPSPIPFGKNVGPACLPFSLVNQTLQGATVQASGFGTIQAVKVDEQNNSPPSNVLLKVDLPFLTSAQCKTYLGTSVTDNMVCTYLPGKDTCQGDSGGSIDYVNPANGRSYVVGVTSFGMGCAQTGYPGVYAKVSNYLPWIQATTQASFCNV